MAAGYAEIFWWLVVAMGAALVTGTGAALWHYRRTGEFPGRPPVERPTGPPPSPRTAVAKCIIGLLLVGGGVSGGLLWG